MEQQPFEITENHLFAKIGRLVVENDVLRAMLAEQTEEGKEDRDEPSGPRDRSPR